ncbi:GNAT family N-acetyltransferase [Acidocella sp.]|uniref:GNAT family N-acetyltransferase n=1 Tax=Acidocella sp. TaxID=50710 RepID=UPI003D09480A
MISIRAATPGDIAAVNRIYNQPSVRRFTFALPYESRAASARFFAAERELRTSLLACAADGTVLGEASLTREANPRRSYAAMLGLMVDEEARRRGTGRALLTALLDLADNWLNLQKLELEVFANNHPAIALYRSLGFEVEATMRHHAMQDGVLTDCLAMARLRPGLPADRSTAPLPPPQAPRQPFILRAMEPEDLPGLTTLMSLPGVCHGAAATPFMAEAALNELTDPASRARAIVAVSGGTLSGLSVLLPGQGRALHTATLQSMMVHDAWQGQGIGRALLTAMLDIADNWLGLSRIGLAVLADNPPAIRLYESLGFEREGRLRADIFRQGGYADSLAMARLR